MSEGIQESVSAVLSDLSSTLGEGVSFGSFDIDGESVRVTLEIDPDECEDCLTPPEILQTILLKRFTNAGLGLTKVEVVESPPA